nr:LysR family transcriptional regulator [uncultured Cohaesibacter sp.]
MIDQIRSMAIFAKVAEAGSFRGAARLLGLSPSVVSQHISNLETRLGLPLIYRSTRNFSLTPDGARLLSSAQKMVAAAEEGLDVFSDIASEPVGVIRMSLPRILNNEVIVALLTRFADLYPGIALRIMFTDEKSNMVRDGLDLVLRVGSLEDSSLKARKLGDIPCFLVASPDYVAKQKKLTHAKDLEEWKFIRHEYIKDEIEMTHPQEGKVVVLGKDQISVDSSSAIIGFALAGAGVAVVLDFSVKQALEEGRLVKLLPEWKLMAPGIYAVYPANSSRNSLARKLVDYLIQNLPNARGARRRHASID